jgi:homoserine dehydrogenase
MAAEGDKRFRVGLLGYGTVGAAFAELLPRHADRIARITGLRPELSAVLTRSRGSFEDILDGSDLIVELIGGLEPAREYLLAAMRAGKHVVTANKQLLSHHGEELWEQARGHDGLVHVLRWVETGFATTGILVLTLLLVVPL